MRPAREGRENVREMRRSPGPGATSMRPAREGRENEERSPLGEDLD